MIDLKQIEYFIVCVQKESFSKAAEALYTTQPSVSKTIKALEQELGMNLFQRHTRGVCLTAEGRQVYSYALAVSENIRKICAMKKEYTECVDTSDME